MNVNHWLVGFAISLLGTCCQAEHPAAGPELGPGEVIGSLLNTETGAIQLGIKLVSLPGEPELLEDMPHESVDPQLGEPILLASLEEPALLIPTISDPSEIQQQLGRTIQLLGAAGLTSESRIVEALQRDFETTHLPRLILERKRAELAKLQAEIDELTARMYQSVSMSIEVIEADAELIRQLDGNWMSTQIVDRETYEKLISSKTSEGKVETLMSPRVAVCSGRAARFDVGFAERPAMPSILLEATPTVVDDDRFRLSFLLGVKETASQRRVQSTVELATGQSIIIALSPLKDDTSKVLVIIITPELARPAEPEDEESVVLPVYFELPPAPIPEPVP